MDPLDFTDKYNTPIPPEKQAAFDSWVRTQTAKNGKSPIRDRYDYDVNGFWLNGAKAADNGHGSDQWKKPNHSTFSNESIYHGKDGYSGGQWIYPPGGGTYYQPSATNLQFKSQPELQQYFNQVEPGINLLPGPQYQPQIPDALAKFPLGTLMQGPMGMPDVPLSDLMRFIRR